MKKTQGKAELLTAGERRIFLPLTSPKKIQEYLDAIPYSTEERYRCPRSVLRDRKAHCYDGALFAAAALQRIGHPPLIVEILPNDRDDDHIIAVYRRNGHWGSVAKSNYVGLRSREPVYSSLRELMMSYFESYYNIAAERTMLGYTAPLDLCRFDAFHWLVDDAAMDGIAERLETGRKYYILTPVMIRDLTKVDKRYYRAGLMGADPKGLLKLEQI